MANQSPAPVLPGPLVVPRNFPTKPAVGKINLLYDANTHELYHKLSPYGYESFLGIKTRQPFEYTYPDEAGKVNNLFIVDLEQRAITDVQRISKFLISQNGILFLANQFLLQTGNAFNETRIYNPASPILGAALPLTLWAARPQRNIDLGNPGSILGSFLGPAVGSILSTRTPVPPGSIGGALPTQNQDGGKGLLRAGTANAAMTNLQGKWSPPSNGAGLGIGGFLSQTIKGLFGNFIPQTQAGIKARSDEGTYGLMLGSFSGDEGPFSYVGAKRAVDGVQQFWFAGTNGGIRKEGQVPLNRVKIYVNFDGSPAFIEPNTSFRIDGLNGTVGYSVTNTNLAVKYGDYVGTGKDQSFEGSDVLIQHSMYSDDSNDYPSKLTQDTDPSVVAIQSNLDRVLDTIQESGVYQVSNPDSNVLITSAQAINGYNRIVGTKRHMDVETAYQFSTLREYRSNNIRVLENQHTDSPQELSMKMGSSRQFDAINRLTVLDGNALKASNWKEWSPYRDDMIALYFYDIVNDKYIPFRATPRGIQETVSVNWEELSFIGRADRVYSYNGYNRSLSFSFTVHIGSIVELAPTWQRINYLMSLGKPSNYTRRNTANDNSGLYTRYIVPPMVMVNLGDMYKNQPVALATIGLQVPDTATWEIQNPVNMPNGWEYLVNYIKAPDIGKMYAQVPKTVEISITCNLLEKERAIAGAAHFGHAPHDETYQKGVYRKTVPDQQVPAEFDKNLISYNAEKSNKPYVGDVNRNDINERTA